MSYYSLLNLTYFDMFSYHLYTVFLQQKQTLCRQFPVTFLTRPMQRLSIAYRGQSSCELVELQIRKWRLELCWLRSLVCLGVSTRYTWRLDASSSDVPVWH